MGLKLLNQAIQQNVEEVLLNVQALLEKKKAGYKADKVGKDILKWRDEAGTDAVNNAANLGLLPVGNAEEFAIRRRIESCLSQLSRSRNQP
jgi:CRISPR-associated protein Csc3